MHTVQHESEEFLWVLLAIAAELACNSAHLTLQVRGRYRTILILTSFVKQFTITRWKSTVPYGTILCESTLCHEILRQRCRRKYALNYWVHKAGVANVSEADGRVPVSASGGDRHCTGYCHVCVCVFVLITIWLIFFFKCVTWAMRTTRFTQLAGDLWAFYFFSCTQCIRFWSWHLPRLLIIVIATCECVCLRILSFLDLCHFLAPSNFLIVFYNSFEIIY